MARRRGSVVNFLQDITDDIKDFVDDELVDRGRTAERDLRRAGRNFFDYDSDEFDRRGGRNEELDELRAAVKALSEQVSELAGAKK